MRGVMVRVLAVAGVLIVGAGVVIAFWPLHGAGVSGTAAFPTFASEVSGSRGGLAFLSVHPHSLRSPHDLVDHRRVAALVLATVGLLVLGATSVATRARAVGSAA